MPTVARGMYRLTPEDIEALSNLKVGGKYKGANLCWCSLCQSAWRKEPKKVPATHEMWWTSNEKHGTGHKLLCDECAAKKVAEGYHYDEGDGS